MKIVDETMTVAEILSDWLGEGGKPVPIELAEARAKHCLKCVEHRGGKWWEIHKNPIASAIKATLAFKNDQKIAVSVEDQLQMCGVCGCAMRLKVHTPTKHFIELATPEQLERFQQVSCWIHQETKTP